MADDKLKFGWGNKKLAEHILTFSLPAGWTCPGAHRCQTFASEYTGKITDGKHQTFRCFSATSEAAFTSVRAARWHNYRLLDDARKRAKEYFIRTAWSLRAQETIEMRELIEYSLPIVRPRLMRVHVSGDFFSQSYFDAWLQVAALNPNTRFYAYTKSLHFWRKRASHVPKNFMLTASIGGKYDELAKELRAKTATVVPAKVDAGEMPIDTDDSHAYAGKRPFALLLHGTQPRGGHKMHTIDSPE